MNGRAVRVVSLVLLFCCRVDCIRKDKDPWKDMSVEVGDIQIHYLEAGTGDRVLVFIQDGRWPRRPGKSRSRIFHPGISE